MRLSHFVPLLVVRCGGGSALCGAMATQFEAQLVESIDCRISKRAIVIIGGGGVESK